MNFKVKLRCIPLFKLLYEYLLNLGHIIAIQIEKTIRRKYIVFIKRFVKIVKRT